MSEETNQIPIAIIPNNIEIVPPIIRMDTLTIRDKTLLINTYQYGRTLKLIVNIDLFFICMNLVFTGNVVYLLPLCLLYYAYYGINNYKRQYVNIYGIYQLISIILNMLYLLYLIKEHTDTVITNNLFFILLNMITNTWIYIICVNFGELVHKVNEKNLIEYLLTGDNSFLLESNWNHRYLL